MLTDVNDNRTALAERREALRRARMADPDAAERAQQLSEAAQQLESGFVGALAAVTGTPAAELRRLGF